MRLVFFGTAEFAVPCLESLVKAGHTVLAVVTAPDKPAGRGYELKGSPVKEAALKLGLTLLQPEKLKAPDFLAQLAALAPELQVVVAFRMLPEVVWAAPPLGTLNVHGSLLPKYRGAAPIHWAVALGESETGVTTFFLKHEVDTGDLIFQQRTPIGPAETTGDVYNRLMALGAALLAKTLAAIEAGTAPALPQVYSSDLPHAPKITTENSKADFLKTAEEVRNHIRGMYPFPCAWATLGGTYMKLHAAQVAAVDTDELPHKGPGHLVGHQQHLLVRCADTWLELTEVQPEGKKRMSGASYINGAGRAYLLANA